MQQPKNQSGTAETIERAALQVFYERGYHGTSIRSIASASGVGIATLFHHYPNKAAILTRVLHRAADHMQADLDAAVTGLTGPQERLSAAARALVVAHCERQSQSFVAQSEMRSVDDPEAAEAIRGKRRSIQRVFDDAVTEGLEAGVFDCEHPREVSRAIVSMGTQVATWYHPGRGMTPEEVAAIYARMALRLVGAAEPEPLPGAQSSLPTSP